MKRKNAKHVLLALVAVAALALSACSSNDNQEADGQAATVGAIETVETVEADTSVIESQPQSEEETESAEAKSDEEESETMTQTAAETADNANPDAPTASEVLSQMTVGWNLGNTFDAWGSPTPLDNETYWGNPKTTKEMIDAVRAQGFNTLRIPVTWSEKTGAAPDYTIDSAWLERVAEVVDYAYSEGMYVILDTHHEPDFWLKPQKDGLDEVKAELAAIWEQLSERFAEYDYHLLFEGMNEPRIKGSPEEWSGGTDEGRAAVNELNKVFVDTVRAAGGENSTRCLILCPYGNSVTAQTITQLEVPDDRYVMVSAHLYTPYFFTYEPDSGSVNEWDGSLKKDIKWAADQLNNNLIKKGIPVIVTEFGAVNKTYTNADGQETQNTQEIIKWLADYMEIMNGCGIKCIWWDNGNYSDSGEKFGIFDRRNLTWYSQEIADALVEYAAKPQN